MKAIINSKSRHIAVIARAGTGKTFTMLEYIKAKPTEKILFLVYNKEMQRDFSSRVKGVNHSATISTIHSLAYRWYIKKYGRKSFKNINVIDIKNIFKKTKLEFGELSLIKFYYNMFLSSDKETIEDLEWEKEHLYLKPYTIKLFDYYKNSDTIQHNFYLKLFQIEKEKINGYDTIIVDETNDLNKCMLSIVANNLDKKIICIGDPLQNINSFNYAVDGLTYLIAKYGFEEYGLTMSFRISEEVASLTSKYLAYMHGKKVEFHGCKNTKFAKLNLRQASPSNQIHLLCRNRLGGLTEILELLKLDRNKKIYYVGGISSFGIEEIEKMNAYNGNVYLGGEKFHISKLREMKAKAEQNDEIVDTEIRRMVSLYDFGQKYKEVLPLLNRTETTNKNEADIIVQTAHSSKGGTFKNVLLAKDFAPIEDVKDNLVKLKGNISEYAYNIIRSEANLLYVALTRATDKLDMNEALNKKSKQSERIVVEKDYK